MDNEAVNRVEIEYQKSRTIVASIINLAHNLKLNVIAEGVETEAQLNYLESTGCGSYQGYLCSKPVPAQHLQSLFQANISNIVLASVAG